MEGSHNLVHAGKTYRVSRLTQKKKDEFSSISKARAIASVVRSRAFLTPEEYETAYSSVMARLEDFAFHSKYTERAVQTDGGALLLAQVLFGCSEEEMVELFSQRGDEVRSLIQLVLRESTPDADPHRAE